MRLSELEVYNPITIQCHDNPDADALGAGFGLYCYFRSIGKKVRLVYSGTNKIKKANLKLMVEKLSIPIEHVHPLRERTVKGLLITVDCQYGAGNVTRLKADCVAVIDHHLPEVDEADFCRIQPNLGSCTTLVWLMLREAGFDVNQDICLGTALYYGLYTDTNQFTELFHPLDMDMRDSVLYHKSLMTLFRNSNLSLKELEIAGIALIRYNYNVDYEFAVIKAQPCDPNILGLISDFLLQVDEIKTCVVYNEGFDGFKVSVRSCIKEVKANELAAYLTKGIGSGGGHYEKAGGTISRRLYEKEYPTLHSEAYFNNRMIEYFNSFEVIYARTEELDLTQYALYRRCKEPLCFVKASDMLKIGADISIHKQEDSIDLHITQEIYFTLERDGALHSMTEESFNRCFYVIEEEMPENYYDKIEYIPLVKDWEDSKTYSLADYAKICIPRDDYYIYAKELTGFVKVFPKWDDDNYMLGAPGDYLAVSAHDSHNIFMESGKDFLKKFVKLQNPENL